MSFQVNACGLFFTPTRLPGVRKNKKVHRTDYWRRA